MPTADVERFKRDVEQLQHPSRSREMSTRRSRAGVGTGGDGKLGLAVSGGPDSVAMLLIAHAAFPGQIEAATCDHRLRPESAAEARFVAQLCAERSIPHTTLTLDLPPKGNISAKARTARYAALESWRADRHLTHILTAHHADDQLETIIMRLNRGAGVGGLAGIRAVNGHVIRPLLNWRRSELAAIVAAANITPIDDPSNRDDRYDRARLRKALASADWLDPLAFLRSAQACAEADDALDGRDPRELQRRCLLAGVRSVQPDLIPRGDQVEATLDAMIAGNTVTLGNVLCGGGDEWTFALAPPRRTP